MSSPQVPEAEGPGTSERTSEVQAIGGDRWLPTGIIEGEDHLGDPRAQRVAVVCLASSLTLPVDPAQDEVIVRTDAGGTSHDLAAGCRDRQVRFIGGVGAWSMQPARSCAMSNAAPGRDPRGRVLATAYLGLVPADAEPDLPDDTAWQPVDALPATAFDHGSIAESGRARLRAKLSYTTIGYALAPRTFTISQLRDIYGAALGHEVSATNLQRVLLRRKVLKPTDTTAAPTQAGGRPASVYEFRERRLLVTDQFAAFRPRASAEIRPQF